MSMMVDVELDETYKDIVRLLKEDGCTTVEDLPYSDLEYPFIYKGMSVEDYWKERVYYGTHWDDIRKGTYEPMWKQRGEEHERFRL